MLSRISIDIDIRIELNGTTVRIIAPGECRHIENKSTEISKALKTYAISVIVQTYVD